MEWPRASNATNFFPHPPDDFPARNSGQVARNVGRVEFRLGVAVRRGIAMYHYDPGHGARRIARRCGAAASRASARHDPAHAARSRDGARFEPRVSGLPDAIRRSAAIGARDSREIIEGRAKGFLSDDARAIVPAAAASHAAVKRRVLILSASSGEGHVRAGQGARESIRIARRLRCRAHRRARVHQQIVPENLRRRVYRDGAARARRARLVLSAY